MNEKEIANNNALTAYATEILPYFTEALNIVNQYFVEPTDENRIAVRKAAVAIKEMYRAIDDYTKALADLKQKVDFCVVDSFNESPEIRSEFKIQEGAKSVKCDALGQRSMSLLMDAFTAKGFDPSCLFSKCSAITAKKAAEAFGLSEQALLEEFGQLFATHVNKPSVKML